MEQNGEKLKKVVDYLGEILVPIKMVNIVAVPIMAAQKEIMAVAVDLGKQEEQSEKDKGMPPWEETAAGSPEHEEDRT